LEGWERLLAFGLWLLANKPVTFMSLFSKGFEAKGVGTLQEAGDSCVGVGTAFQEVRNRTIFQE